MKKSNHRSTQSNPLEREPPASVGSDPYFSPSLSLFVLLASVVLFFISIGLLVTVLQEVKTLRYELELSNGRQPGYSVAGHSPLGSWARNSRHRSVGEKTGISIVADKVSDDCTYWKDDSIPLTPSHKITGMGIRKGRVLAPGVPPLSYYLKEDGVKEFTLVAQPIEQKIMDVNDYKYYQEIIPPQNWPSFNITLKETSKTVRIWGYNGHSPGPLIEVNRGDRVRVILKNELPEPTSIHWHGQTVPWEMDGSGGISEPATNPGGKRIYEFNVTQCGTFFYHSGCQIWKQDTYGLAGMFISHCHEDPPADADFAFFLDGYTFESENSTCNAWMSGGDDWQTFNGLVAPSIPVLKVKEGDNVRLRFANVRPESHPIHLHGHVWKNIANDGTLSPTSAQTFGSTVNVNPGESRDVYFTARPGIWRLHCHKVLHTTNDKAFLRANPSVLSLYGGMFTLLCVEGTLTNGTYLDCKM